MSERHPDVGYSDKRTPAKHRILRRHAGRDIGAARYAAAKIGRLWRCHRFIDLTAGDATQNHVSPWDVGSSPAIFAKLAAQNAHTRVDLYEINPSTFDRLATNLTLRLPDLGYKQIGELQWAHPRESLVTATHGDGANVTFDDLRDGEWLYVNNDPNNMEGWTLNMERFAELRQQRVATFMSTMGCNSGGLKRLPLNRRSIWFDHIDHAIRVVSRTPWLDLIIFKIENDAAQWAYLQLVPRKWVEKTVIEMGKIFQSECLEVSATSFYDDADSFYLVCEELFMTKREREGDAA